MSTVKLSEAMGDIDNDSGYIDELAKPLVDACCGKLDDFIKYVSSIISDRDNPVTDAELDDIILTIPTLVYFAGEMQEQLGIKYDVSNTRRQNIFNSTIVNTSGTVMDKKAIAELGTEELDMIKIVYARAYNCIKMKISTAMELLQSAKKIVSRRMQSLELSNVTRNSDRRITDE